MSKSRYSKIKTAGLLCGVSRCKDYKFTQANADLAQIENRQMRRLRKKKVNHRKETELPGKMRIGSLKKNESNMDGQIL